MPKDSAMKINLKPLITVVVGLAAIAGLWWGFDDRYAKSNQIDELKAYIDNSHGQLKQEIFKQAMRVRLNNLINRRYRIQDRLNENPELKTYYDELLLEIRRAKERLEKLEES